MRFPAGRVAAAVGALAVLLGVAVGYVVHAADRGAGSVGGTQVSGQSAAGDVGSVTAGGHYYVFKSSALDRDFGRVAVASASDPGRRVFAGSLKCNRVAETGGRGLCLQLALGVTVTTEVSVLDANLNPTHHLTLPGYPSRTRVSPDGRLAAATTFVSGDSYASLGFSTRTSIIDLTAGTVLFDLEKLAVTQDGRAFHEADFNFWGVTFEPDSRHFYATLGSGGKTYLIHGDVRSRTATVVTTGVECPSLSPDGRLIAFKKRVSDDPVAWRLWILDVATGAGTRDRRDAPRRRPGQLGRRPHRDVRLGRERRRRLERAARRRRPFGDRGGLLDRHGDVGGPRRRHGHTSARARPRLVGPGTLLTAVAGIRHPGTRLLRTSGGAVADGARDSVAIRGDLMAQLSPWPVVRKGDEDHPVRTLQDLLRARGHAVTVDGIFGSATEAAVRAFQQAKHLTVDGVVGPMTWAALVVTVHQGSTGDAVRGVQEEFQFRNLSGDPSKGLAVDGVFGAKTDAAVRGFQQALHTDIPSVTVDGVVGPVTWQALVSGMLSG